MLNLLLCKSSDMADDWSKVGRPVELNLRKAIAIRGDDARHSIAVRIRRVEIDVEFVRDCTLRR